MRGDRTVFAGASFQHPSPARLWEQGTLSRSARPPLPPASTLPLSRQGGGATLCCPRRSPRHLAGAQVTRAPSTHGPRAQCPLSVPGSLLRGRVGSRAARPHSRDPEQKQVFTVPSMARGSASGGWITGPGANQGSPKIPKAAADTASESV